MTREHYRAMGASQDMADALAASDELGGQHLSALASRLATDIDREMTGMTQAELNALPETGRLRFVDAEGKRLMRPVFDDIGVLWHGGEDEPIAVKDVNGQR